MEFETILTTIGETGVYQIIFFFSLWFYQAFHGMQSSFVNFVSPHHEHWCRIDNLVSYSPDIQKNISIPYIEDDYYLSGYEQCYMYNLQWDNYSETTYATWNRTKMTEGTDIIECNNGWVYDRSVFRTSMTSEVRCILYPFPIFHRILKVSIQTTRHIPGCHVSECTALPIYCAGVTLYLGVTE